MAHFKDLIVWQTSIDLAEFIYHLTETFPNHQKYSLVDQMQRASVSIMSNIAEGSKRTPREWINFLRIAFGSSAELESQCILAKRLNYISEKQYTEFEDRLYHVTRILNKMLYSKS
jgi:four helix bundle protein